MPFQLELVTQVVVSNANPRRELHGEDKVRAIDLSFSLTGENTLLDLIEPGLREHHYFNKALKDGQEALPGVVIPMPNLRYPKLPQSYSYAKGILESLSPRRQTLVTDVSEIVKEKFAEGNEWGAYEECLGITDVEEKTALWSLLPSNIRSAITKLSTEANKR